MHVNTYLIKITEDPLKPPPPQKKHAICSSSSFVQFVATASPLTLFRMGLFGATHGWGEQGGGAKRPPP